MKTETVAEASADTRRQADEPLVLYQVSSTVERFPHRGHDYKGVQISWLVHRRTGGPPVPYKEAIVDYEQLADHKVYAEGCVDELFTEAEAKVFQAYLLAVHDDKATVKEVALPMDCKNTIPIGAVPVGGGNDFYMLAKEPGYNLSFEVWGYFDVRGHECIERESEEEVAGDPKDVLTSPQGGAAMDAAERDRLRIKAFKMDLPPAYGLREIERSFRYVESLSDQELRKMVLSAPKKCTLCQNALDGRMAVEGREPCNGNLIWYICDECGEFYWDELRRVANLRKTKQRLLDKYANKQPTEFAQFDAFVNVDEDDVMHPDADGDGLCRTETVELMSGFPAVRVLITKGAPIDGKKAVVLLEKIAKWVAEEESFKSNRIKIVDDDPFPV